MYYFDSDECMSKFYENPEQYAGKSVEKEPGNVRPTVATGENTP